MNKYETLAHRIKFAREYRQLTQSVLAKKSGLKQSDISKLETGRMSSTTSIVGLAKALQCSIVWLDSGKGEPWNLKHNTTAEMHLINIPIRGSSYFKDQQLTFSEIQKTPENSHLPYFSTDLEAYAIQCTSNDISPRVKKNEYIIVEPNHPITNGDEVIIINKQHEVAIKQYIYRRDGQIYLTSVNTKNELSTIPDNNIEHMHFITGYAKST